MFLTNYIIYEVSLLILIVIIIVIIIQANMSIIAREIKIEKRIKKRLKLK